MVVVCPMSEIEKIVTALADFPVDVLFLPNIEMPKTAYRNIIQSNTIRVMPLLVAEQHFPFHPNSI